MNTPVVALLAGLVSMVLIGLLARGAHRLGLIDRPGGHKQHATPVPLVGGIAIAVGLGAAVTISHAAAGSALSVAMISTLLATLMMLLVGLRDDRHGLSPRVRFVFQAAAAVLMAWPGAGLLQDLGALFGGDTPVQLGWFAWPMTVFSMVGVMNACNMSDGIDGAAGTLAVLALMAMMFLAGGATSSSLALAALIGAVLGFLYWNVPLFRSARAYLGDGGSLFIGAWLAWQLTSLSQGEQRAFTPVAALWLYALPLMDTVSVMWRRLAEGLSPFQPDQRHLHHVMLRSGCSVRRAWLMLAALALIGIAVGIAATLLHWPDAVMAAAFLGVAFLHHGVMRHADRHARWLGRSLAPDVASVVARPLVAATDP